MSLQMPLRLRDLTPSVGRRLMIQLGDQDTHPWFLGELRDYLSSLDVDQAAEIDYAQALSHELTSLGVWDVVSYADTAQALSTVNSNALRAFFSVAPAKLEQEVLALSDY
ncbi:hypothetical protein [Sulfitobacter sp. R18_1]|uniref:hypothetical protein n=1 Tax=Sulfitobacter sp. R18_1 TaxID=2821104 RepID=UPI001ADC43FD|nr:hypothetical protein [Sulfitobacter sp. R18_1]MBO9428276.1 hypothetical protein [Sulfitobacter sp. R18_1]